MKAMKKPIPITVEEFQPDQEPWPNGVSYDIDGNGAREYYVVSTLHGVKVPLEAGDFVNVSNEKDLYPIKRDVFYATYDIVE